MKAKKSRKGGKALKITLAVLLCLAIVYGVCALLPRKDNFALENPMRKTGELPLLIAHGGGNKEFPDNTLEAFYNAYSVDPNVMMETDVSITCDGVVILSHDVTLDRKTNVCGAIADWNYSDLIAQRVDFGYTNPTKNDALSGERVHFKDENGQEKYPADVDYPEGVTPRDESVFLATTLDELLTAFPNNRVNVEIKQEGELGMIAQRVDFGYTNPTKNDALSGERVHFKDENGQEKYPADVDYPEGVTPRDESVFLATTLDELLTAFPNNRVNVEIKQEGELGMKALREVLRIVEAHDAFDRVVLASFHEEIYSEFQRLQKAGEVPETFMYSPAYKSAIAFYALQLTGLDALYGDRLCVFQLPTEQYGINLATKRLIDTAHSHNLAVHYWTVNDVDEMKELIEIGADGIMTDYPHRLQAVYESYGK